MGIRRQIYLDEKTDRLLGERSQNTGLSVSALIREAVTKTYGLGPRLTWEQVFSHSVKVNSAGEEDGWVYDRLFDDEYIDEILDELDRHSTPGI